VNLPSLEPETYKILKPWIDLSEKIGSLHSQLFGGEIRAVTVRYGGDVAKYPLSTMTIAVIKGLLHPICGDSVNFVNAPEIAKERGIVVNESRSTQTEDFTNYIEVEVSAGAKKEANRIMGTLFGKELPRVVHVNEFNIETEPKDVILFIQNEDKPGVVGTLGTILGKNKINIAEMSLGRVLKGKKMLALTVINTDNDVSGSVLTEIKKFPPIIDAKVVKL
jgi:D-3-phosphoglycerate dehydrogenase / 2-oxoglutarate reductase